MPRDRTPEEIAQQCSEKPSHGGRYRSAQQMPNLPPNNNLTMLHQEFQGNSFLLHYCLYNELYRVHVTHLTGSKYRLVARKKEVVIDLDGTLISGDVPPAIARLWAAAIYINRFCEMVEPEPEAGKDQREGYTNYLAAARIKRPKR